MAQTSEAEYQAPCISYLSAKQQRRMHEASLEILERVGARLQDEESIRLLVKAGAKVDEDGRVHFPPKQVEWALSRAPKSVRLYDREGRSALLLEKGRVFFGPGSDCLSILDHRTGERRQPNTQDLQEAIRVCDGLPNVDFIMSAFLPADVPPERANRVQMRAMLEHSSKPILFVTNDFASSLDVLQAAEIVAGGVEALARRPFCGCYINVTAPLRHNADSLQKLRLLAGKGIPTTYTPMVLQGVSGPVTNAGATALANAGELVGLVLAQLVREGTPVIHSGGYVDVFDMHTMVDAYCGPESYGSRTSLAAYYGLPSFGLGGASDSKLPDEQAAAEAALTLLLESLAGVNLVHDLGYLESGRCCSLQMLAVCDELAGYIRHFRQGIEVSKETLALDLIAELGPDGDYLSSEHTLRHYKEGWLPTLFDRNHFDGWVAAGKKSMGQRARERVEDILQTHAPIPLPPETRRRIIDILG
ncbi:MAG: trimethylamine methyltransferase family protein [Spirochaetia bacterium]